MRSCGIVLAWGYAWLGDAIWLVAGCLAAPENSSPTSPLHQHWCLSGLTRRWSRHSDSVSSCAGLQEAKAGYEKGTTPSYSTQPLQSLNGAQGVAQSKMTAFHLTGVQPRTQGFVSTLSVQGREGRLPPIIQKYHFPIERAQENGNIVHSLHLGLK